MAEGIAFQDAKARKFIKKLLTNSVSVSKLRREYVRLIQADVFKDIISHFESEMGPKKKWEPWSDLYKERMIATGKGGNKILQDTGRLRQNMKPADWKTTAQGIVFFNDAKTKSGFPYAFGHDKGGKVLPQRKFMWLSKKAQSKILKNTLRFMAGERG